MTNKITNQNHHYVTPMDSICHVVSEKHAKNILRCALECFNTHICFSMHVKLRTISHYFMQTTTQDIQEQPKPKTQKTQRMSSSMSTLISSSLSQTLKIRTLIIPLSPHTLFTSKTPPSSISLTNTNKITMFTPQPNQISEHSQRVPPEIPSLPKVHPSPVPSEKPVIPTPDPETDPNVPPEIVTTPEIFTDPAPGPYPNPKPDAPKPPLTPPGIETPLPKPPEKVPQQPPEVDPPRPPEILPPPSAPPPGITPPTGPSIIG